MADLSINSSTVTNYSIAPFVKRVVLDAGEKLANDTELIALAQKTVPSGYRVTADIMITINVEKL